MLRLAHTLEAQLRAAMERAAMRRGCVWPMTALRPSPASRQIFGSWVLFPDPVSPQTIKHFRCIREAMIS